jgi:polyphosphate kinase
MSDAVAPSEYSGGQEAEVVSLPPTLFLHRQLLFNRELSWIEFNARVLEEAEDPSLPLLERVKFLAIFSTNLDEFFMIRVSGLKQQIDEGVTELSPDGMSPAQQLEQISERLAPLLERQMRCLNNDVLPELARYGTVVSPFRALSDHERRLLNTYYLENVFPVLTPLAVDPSHPFPYISNLSLNLGVMVSPPEPEDETDGSAQAVARFARIKVPPIVPRLIPVPGSTSHFVLLEDLICANIATLFPGANVGESHPFRVTRDADMEIRDDEANDLLKTIESELRKRRFGTCVRLEVSKAMPGEMVRYLAASMGLEATDAYSIDGPLDVSGLMNLYDTDLPDLKHKALSRRVPPALSCGEPIFDVLKRQDVLVHHPYDSFSTIVDFVSAAASDPDVLAIKTTLYRTGRDSPIVQALMKACENNKQVAALIELKARFDEENNIGWARQLERAGVHVVYGMLGLKTHCKLALVVRKEASGLRRYVHIGTGNYNQTTSRIYDDVGLLTSDEMIGADATDLFNHLTGYSNLSSYRKVLVAPVTLRDRMIGMIEREAAHHKAGRPARMIVKINHLTDTKMIRALYEASQAGLPIDLIVRGICSLRPGLEGLSSTITVRSIVGRFLEHSRIFYFLNGGDEEAYIGSADWMHRNLDRRVELVTPIEDPHLRLRLKTDFLDAYLRDNVNARKLLPDGSYELVHRGPSEEPFDCHAFFATQFGHSEAQ